MEKYLFLSTSVSSPSNQIVTRPLIHELQAFLTALQQTRSVQKIQQFSMLFVLMKPDAFVLDQFCFKILP